MFSLKKPLHLGRLGDFFDRNGDWYKGEFFDYGIEIPNIQLNEAETVHWRWDKPKGTSQSPYRLKDFVGYYHKAPKMTVMGIPSEIFSNGEDVNLFTTFRPSTDKSIGYDLIFPNQNRYLCMMIKKGSSYKMRTATNPIGHANGNYDYVTLTKAAIEWLGAGTHKAISFLSNEAIPDWTSAPASRILYYAGYADAIDSNVKSFVVKQFIPEDIVISDMQPDVIDYCMTKEMFTISVTAKKSFTISARQIKGFYQNNLKTVDTTLYDIINKDQLGFQDTISMKQGESKVFNVSIGAMWVDGNGIAIRPPATNEKYTFRLNLIMPSSEGIGHVGFVDDMCECYSKDIF
ncbi:MAG: hypothetical protein ACRCS6_09865 [Turicibacter sp.]